MIPLSMRPGSFATDFFSETVLSSCFESQELAVFRDLFSLEDTASHHKQCDSIIDLAARSNAFLFESVTLHNGRRSESATIDRENCDLDRKAEMFSSILFSELCYPTRDPIQNLRETVASVTVPPPLAILEKSVLVLLQDKVFICMIFGKVIWTIVCDFL